VATSGEWLHVVLDTCNASFPRKLLKIPSAGKGRYLAAHGDKSEVDQTA